MSCQTHTKNVVTGGCCDGVMRNIVTKEITFKNIADFVMNVCIVHAVVVAAMDASDATQSEFVAVAVAISM